MRINRPLIWDAVRHCTLTVAPRAEGESKMKLGPRPKGRPWTPAEDAQLLALFDSKMDRALIARKLKRTVPAMRKRRAILNKRRLVEG